MLYLFYFIYRFIKYTDIQRNKLPDYTYAFAASLFVSFSISINLLAVSALRLPNLLEVSKSAILLFVVTSLCFVYFFGKLRYKSIIIKINQKSKRHKIRSLIIVLIYLLISYVFFFMVGLFWT